MRAKKKARTILVYVTQDCIRRGKSREAALCPVALALQAAGIKRAHVDTAGWWVANKHGVMLRSGAIPKQVATFITKYDNGGHVHPFEFKLRSAR